MERIENEQMKAGYNGKQGVQNLKEGKDEAKCANFCLPLTHPKVVQARARITRSLILPEPHAEMLLGGGALCHPKSDLPIHLGNAWHKMKTPHLKNDAHFKMIHPAIQLHQNQKHFRKKNCGISFIGGTWVGDEAKTGQQVGGGEGRSAAPTQLAGGFEAWP